MIRADRGFFTDIAIDDVKLQACTTAVSTPTPSPPTSPPSPSPPLSTSLPNARTYSKGLSISNTRGVTSPMYVYQGAHIATRTTEEFSSRAASATTLEVYTPDVRSNTSNSLPHFVDLSTSVYTDQIATANNSYNGYSYDTKMVTTDDSNHNRESQKNTLSEKGLYKEVNTPMIAGSLLSAVAVAVLAAAIICIVRRRHLVMRSGGDPQELSPLT